ncbi:MAG: hypothetical protein HY888_07610 [Deltaproteobacteria bacterium]|nr:hypothetical protein [Deltaproteobacteria bacterium]
MKFEETTFLFRVVVLAGGLNLEHKLMTHKDIETLFLRLARLVHASQEKAGTGTAWDYSFPNGETHRYIFRNIRSHIEIEDCVSNLLIWIWNTKDYLKLRLEAKVLDPKLVEQFINNDSNLLVCRDLAIQLKHGKADLSRSGKFPRLGEVSFSAPQSAISTFTFKAFEVDIDIGNPNEIEYRIPILDKDGNEFGEAFELITSSISGLEKLRDDIEGIK